MTTVVPEPDDAQSDEPPPDDAPSEDGPGGDFADLSDAEREVLLAEYRELKSDARELSRRWNRRITRGTVVVILVIGYAATKQPLVIAVAPLPIMLFLIAHAMGENHVARLYSQIARIEHRVDVEGFGYVRQFDLYSPKFWTPERQIPIYVMNGFIGFVFVLSMAFGLRAVADYYCPLCPETIVVGAVYLVLSLTAGLLFWSNRRIYRREVREIADLVGRGSDPEET